MRVREVFASFELLVSMFRMDVHAGLSIKNGIPDRNFRVVGVFLDPERRCVRMHVEHRSFEDIPEGGYVPKMQVEFVACKDNHPCACGHNVQTCRGRRK
jgi:hypothetical protein